MDDIAEQMKAAVHAAALKKVGKMFEVVCHGFLFDDEKEQALERFEVGYNRILEAREKVIEAIENRGF